MWRRVAGIVVVGYRYMLAFAYAIPDKFEVYKSTDSLEEYEPSGVWPACSRAR